MEKLRIQLQAAKAQPILNVRAQTICVEQYPLIYFTLNIYAYSFTIKELQC